MLHYTAYTRSGAAVVTSSIGYSFTFTVIVGLMMDEYPALEDELIFSLLFVMYPLCYILSMLTSKSKLDVLIDKDRVSFYTVRSAVSRLPINAFLLSSVRNIQLKNGLMSGSYMLLELEYGLTMRLYSKQFFFVRNSLFYEMFLELKKATERIDAIVVSSTMLPPEVNTVSEEIPVVEEINAPMQEHEADTITEAPTAIHSIAEEPAYTPADAYVKKPFITITLGGNPLSENYPPAVYFKGSQFTSAIGIVTWGLFLLFCMFPLLLGPAQARFIGLLPILMGAWAILAAIFFSYVGVSATHVEIRKQNVPWFRRAYNLKDVKEVLLESHGMLANTITIVLKDFRYETYSCASIRPAQWKELKAAFEQANIKVQDRSDR